MDHHAERIPSSPASRKHLLLELLESAEQGCLPSESVPVLRHLAVDEHTVGRLTEDQTKRIQEALRKIGHRRERTSA